MKKFLSILLILSLPVFALWGYSQKATNEWVDYVNPYMGNISHLLVPTYPTISLPNSLLRVYPMRESFTDDKLNGLPVILTNHRGSFAFSISPFQGEGELLPVIRYNYDNEKITPYRYQAYLDDMGVDVDFAPSHQSAIYSFNFSKTGSPYLVVNSEDGYLTAENGAISGYQYVDDSTKVYLYLETDQHPVRTGTLLFGEINDNSTSIEGHDAALAMSFAEDVRTVHVRYGISFISADQAKKNLKREIKGYDVNAVADSGRQIWNEALGKISISGGSYNDKVVFYTSLYRCYERPVCMSEDGFYYSGFDKKVHKDEGRPFYSDDWIWDTYRAAHPLRILIDKAAENNILNSYLLMAKQMGTGWMPTFPRVTGPSWLMNCNHAVASMLDAYRKGLKGFNLSDAFLASKKAIEEKTLIPWSHERAGWIDSFYKTHGYIPALLPDEKETLPNVSSWEKRQPVAVTLGTSYDEWCLSQIAQELGKKEDAKHYLLCSYNYRKLFNPATRFFHPKDKDGNFIKDVDYKYTGRQYFCENNGFIHRWDVQHGINDLISLMGGKEAFTMALDSLFDTPLGMSKWQFYAVMPDHTANVGLYSMGNEPCLHIPYLYNYGGKPWKTQKLIRTLLKEWFRNDLMGEPGDEDGGGMSAFVVFSMMGFYPVTPGLPIYNIGSPVFNDIRIDMGDGKTFEIIANGASDDNKYIQSATINGKPLNQFWFRHADCASGGILTLTMGPKANMKWGVDSSPLQME